MRSLGIHLVSLFLLFEKGFTLRCMNCTSSTLAPLAGCRGKFTPGFLIECPPEASFCQVLRYKGANEEIGVIQYDRICANDFREECVADIERDGVTCIFSCQQDGCNSMNIFPNELEYSTPVPPTNMTTNTDTPRPLICYNCTSDPDDLSDPDCGRRMSNDSLIECHPQERYCLVSKVFSAEFYIRTCSQISLNQCDEYDYEGLVCHRTCARDRCNDFTEFPKDLGELEDAAQTTTTADAPDIGTPVDVPTTAHSDSFSPHLFMIVTLAGLVLTFLKT